MGAYSNRAFCPKCGGKIHTQRGIFSPIRHTGKECQHCGVALTGKVDLRNRGVLADPTGPDAKPSS